MTPYEKNCAVSEKLGLEIQPRISTDGNKVCELVNHIAVFKDYCNDPRDYMKLAIEHEITIYMDIGRVKCFDPIGALDVRWHPKSQTGHAVVDAFLKMEI